MSLTLGNWVVVALVAILLIGSTVLVTLLAGTESSREHERRNSILAGVGGFILTVAVTVGMIGGMDWWNTHTASGIRGYKDFQSNMDNGMYREIVITAEDGREIFRHEGTFDVERHADGDDRYIRFESEDGKRYTISYGVQDTVLIIEKDAK